MKCYTTWPYLPLGGQGYLRKEQKENKTGRDQRHFLWGGGLSMQPPRLDRDDLAGMRKEAFTLNKHEAVLGDEVQRKKVSRTRKKRNGVDPLGGRGGGLNKSTNACTVVICT